MLQQPYFFIEPAGIACEPASGAENTMAGNYNGDRVMSHSAAHGLRGHFFIFPL